MRLYFVYNFANGNEKTFFDLLEQHPHGRPCAHLNFRKLCLLGVMRFAQGVKGELNREWCTTCRTILLMIAKGNVHFNFHERSELTSILTSIFTSETWVIFIYVRMPYALGMWDYIYYGMNQRGSLRCQHTGWSRCSSFLRDPDRGSVKQDTVHRIPP